MSAQEPKPDAPTPEQAEQARRIFGAMWAAGVLAGGKFSARDRRNAIAVIAAEIRAAVEQRDKEWRKALGGWPEDTTPQQVSKLITQAHQQLEQQLSDLVQGEAFEVAAGLHESVDVACDHERQSGAPGAGAMAAVIQYRDLIRQRARGQR